MRRKIIVAVAVAAGVLATAQSGTAQPVRCSGELKTCITNCSKNPNRAVLGVCVTNCRTLGSNCMRTGCWDNGPHKYCGLTRR
jgi:hypothetical protein